LRGRPILSLEFGKEQDKSWGRAIEFRLNADGFHCYVSYVRIFWIGAERKDRREKGLSTTFGLLNAKHTQQPLVEGLWDTHRHPFIVCTKLKI
jgi:hypothetical protein